MEYLIFSAGILLLYYCFFLLRIFSGVTRLKKQQYSGSLKTFPKISVVIPFRNEAENITSLLASLENQTYPMDKFEVIMVDDHSDDNSIDTVKSYSGRLAIKIIELKPGDSGKKKAITMGVANASGEIIAGTDADCTHASGWLAALASGFDDATGLVTGPVTLDASTTMLQTMQLLEHAGLSLSGAGLIATGHPVICSGANISYRKSLFDKINGFDAKHGMTSGDDEQLMHKIYYDEGRNIKFIFDKKCLVTTSAQQGTGDFLQQRRRWASKSFNYRPKTILMLTPLFLFFALWLVLVVNAIIAPEVYGLPLLALTIIKLAADFLVLYQGVPVYIRRFPFTGLLLAEVLHPFYIVYSVLAGVFAGFNWKSRAHRK